MQTGALCAFKGAIINLYSLMLVNPHGALHESLWRDIPSFKLLRGLDLGARKCLL